MTQAAPLIFGAPTPSPTPAVEDHEAELFRQIGESIAADLDAVIDVQRSEPGKGRTFLGSIPAGDFSKEEIQRRYGGGRYCCTLKHGSKWAKTATFNVEAPARPATATDVAPARPTGADGSALEFLREELRFQREMMMQMLARGNAPSAGADLMPLVATLIQNNSGPGQFSKAVELVMQLQAMTGGGQPAGGGIEGMLETLAAKVIERMDRAPARRPALQPPAPPAAPEPARTEATPVAASKASAVWPAAMLAAEEKLGIPLRAMATDLEHAAVSGVDSEAAGFLLFRRLTKARALTPEDASFFEQFDEALATSNLVEWVPALAPHRAMVQTSIENMVGLVLGQFPDPEEQA